jgi:outer membrane protein insertion porin family
VKPRKTALSLGEVRSPVLLLFSLLLGAAAFGQQSGPPGRTRLEGRVIEQITFEPPEQPLPRPELERLLPFKTGAPLKGEDVRTALQNLYDTGRYADVSVDAQPLGEGVAIIIATEFNYFVSAVTLEGESSPPNRNQLITASKLELGAPFNLQDAIRAVENIQDRLRANGLFGAHIQYRLERDPGTEEVSIHFELDPGERARFNGATVKGTFNRTPESIVQATRWHRGFGPIPFPGWRPMTEGRVQSGLDRIRRLFQKDDRLQVHVTLDDLNYDGKTNTVKPSLTIDSGPIIEVRTTGAKVSKRRLRQLIPVYEERTVDRSLLVEGNRNLLDYFQSEGYFDAEADFIQSTEANGVQVIDYSIMRNARHKLVAIEIAGNQFFDQETIRERLSIREAGLLRYRYGRYSQRLRDQDRDSIRSLYRANGFRDVVVDAITIDDYRGREDELGVRFEIQEGPQWFVESLEMEGTSEEDASYLRGIIRSSEGQSFSEANVAADRDTILGYFLNNGYPNAGFDWSQTEGSAPQRVRLRYVVRPGERQFVRGVLIRGLDNTRADLVANRILIHSGSAISQSQIAESQQKLYALGIFAKVQTALQNPEGKEESKYVMFNLDEAAKYSLTAGFGAALGRIGGGVTTLDNPAGTAGFSPRVTLGLSRLNLLGLAHTGTVQALASNYQQRALASYIIPQFTGEENLSLSFSGLFDLSRDVRTYSSRRWEGSVQLAQRLSRANTLQYRFTFRRTTLSDVKITPGLVPLVAQPARVGLLSTALIQDRRDNPIDSRRGVLNTVDLGVSLPQFGSETDYARILLRNSTYHPIGRDLVVARTLQFGYTQRIGGLPEIPLSERFFSGGNASQRAFPDNQAGPRDLLTGFPLGGTALLFHQTELRFPLIGENVGGVLFHDMGNVYTAIDTVSFRFRQKDAADFDYMVQSVGFGIRYKTPIGPIRLDLSFSPNPPKFVGLKGTVDDLIKCVPNDPNPPPFCQPVPQSINKFQFHFSLGQTF